MKRPEMSIFAILVCGVVTVATLIPYFFAWIAGAVGFAIADAAKEGFSCMKEWASKKEDQ